MSKYLGAIFLCANASVIRSWMLGWRANREVLVHDFASFKVCVIEMHNTSFLSSVYVSIMVNKTVS